MNPGLMHRIEEQMEELEMAVRAVPIARTEEEITIESLPGKRNFLTLVKEQTFISTTTFGNQITFEISQDGFWVMTHYPIIGWKPSLPANAQNFGRWRPVSTWPLPDQVLDADRIDISYKFRDVGSERQLQDDNPAPGLLISHPGNLVPLPKPVLFNPKTRVGFTPTFHNITFSIGQEERTTQGTLVIALVGYKIIDQYS